MFSKQQRHFWHNVNTAVSSHTVDNVSKLVNLNILNGNYSHILHIWAFGPMSKTKINFILMPFSTPNRLRGDLTGTAVNKRKGSKRNDGLVTLWSS